MTFHSPFPATLPANKKYSWFLATTFAMALALLLPTVTGAQSEHILFKGKGPWHEQTSTGDINLYLYFFWSKECQHCRRAKPFLEDLQTRYPWIMLEQKEITQYPENKKLFSEMVDSLGETSRAVPTLMFCGGMLQGFDKPENSGAELTTLLKDCRQQLTAFLAPPEKLPKLPPQRPAPLTDAWWFRLSGFILLLFAGALLWRTRRLKK